MSKEKRAGGRDLRGYGRWLRVWAGAARFLLRGETPVRCVLWTRDAAAELLASGFPGLLAVPEELFAETAALFPNRCRLAAAGKGEDELLETIRAIEGRSGLRFDWDAFLERCEREKRRARRISALVRSLESLVPPSVDTRSALAALRSLGREKSF